MATILVAEDEAAVREHLRLELGERGYHVVTASDGLEAIAALGNYDLDLVLADTRIPGFDGTQIRAWKQLAPDTEVVVATSQSEIAGAIECVKGGAFDFIEKPYAIQSLVTTIERALERRQLRVASALHEASRVILTARDPARLPEVIVAVAIKAMNADDVALLIPGDDGRLHLACSTAVHDHVRNTVDTVLGSRVQELAPSLREPLITQRGSVLSCILYPLFSGDRLVGLLEISRVTNPRRFTKNDLDKAAVLASQILLALENMRLMRHAISTERLATVGQVATSIAHEVNNPIAYVLASQQHMKEQLDAAEALTARLEGGTDVLELRARLGEIRAAIDEIRDGADRVRAIVRDTRTLAQTHDTPVPLDINEPIRSALRIVAAELRHRTTVTTELTEGLDVLGRPGRLAQVFVNLLVHIAERFKNDSTNAITVTTKRLANQILVRVRDNAPSFPPEDLPRLFDPFFTTNLAICRDIVRAHGGEISVESFADRGTTFNVVLPETVAPQPERRTDTAASASVGGTRLRILLIDDEPNILKAYRRVLREHDLVFAAHGEEALARIAEYGDFELVLCDVSMPTMSGMELFERVRELSPALAERFVFATGGATQKSVEQFLASIPNVVLEKPFDMKILKKLIAERQRTS